MSDWTTVAQVAELPKGKRLLVDLDDTSVLLFNLDGAYYAIENLCTHDEERMDEGEVKNGTITCPHHGAIFCIKTGAALSAPAFEATATFPVQVQDGAIQIRDPRWD